MTGKRGYDQGGQTVSGNQTNIGVANAPIFSGQFVIQGNFIYNEATKVRLPFQRPPRVPHFTGREAELAALLHDLQPGRAVTICGPGGMGKTALSAEAIWQLAPGSDPPQRFPDGIIFYTFYHRPQAALALEALARAYDKDPHPNPQEAAMNALARRQALIVLDGAEACEDLGAVLSVMGGCGVLITTRRHSDAPDDFGDLLALPMDKAVQLLQAWAGKMASDNNICQKICALLGCLPLAIFLVGRYMAHRRQTGKEYLAWLEKTPLAALHFGDRQHQSISLLMDHSLAQVSDQARACLGVASVLAQKPFEPEIIAIALYILLENANNSLGELVDFGLLMRPEENYQISHALIHTYARKNLAPSSRILAGLAEHYNNFIKKQTSLGLAGYALLDSQRDHILAVQLACYEAGLWEAVGAITWAIEDYLDLQGHWTERIAVIQAGLNAARSDKAQYDEAAFLNLLGLAYNALGESRKAIEFYEQALAISKEIGDQQGEGAVPGNLGNAYRDLGETRKAIEYFEQILKLHREIGDRWNEGKDLNNLGIAYADLGEFRKAIEYYEQDLAIAREIGDRRGEGAVLGNLGIAYSHLGETRKAIEYYGLRLTIAREIGDMRGEANALFNSSLTLHQLGEHSEAIEKAEDALQIFEQMESPNAERVKQKLAEWGK